MTIPEVSISQDRPMSAEAQRHLDFIEVSKKGMDLIREKVMMGIVALVCRRSVEKELDQYLVDLGEQLPGKIKEFERVYKRDGIITYGGDIMQVLRNDLDDDQTFTILNMSSNAPDASHHLVKSQVLILNSNGEVHDSSGPLMTKLEFAHHMFDKLSQGEAVYRAWQLDPGTLSA